MRAMRRCTAVLLAVSLLGVIAWPVVRVRSVRAATVQTYPIPLARQRVAMLSACVDGFSSIDPCAVSAPIFTIGDSVTRLFRFDNNENMDQTVSSGCIATSFTTCSVSPSLLVVHAGQEGSFTLKVKGTSGGKGAVVIELVGDGDVQGTDTITVNPIKVSPTTTIQEAPDTTYTQSFTVQNLGTVADTVNLGVSCSTGFTCSLLTTTPMALAAHGTGTANVSVTTSGQGTSGTVTLGATPTHGVGGESGTVTVNIPMPLPPTVSVLPHNGYNHDLSLCAASCFNVTAGYTTPAYTSLDVPRAVSLVYSSAMAYPLGVVQVDVKDPSFRLAQQISVSAVRGGVNETFTNGTTELYVSQGAMDTSTKRLAAQLATVLSTGVYHDTTIIKSRWTSGGYTGTVTQTAVPTTLLIDNEQSSPFGSGWSIAGLSRVVFGTDSLSLAITNGTGSVLLFTRPTKTSAWVAPAGDFTRFTQIPYTGTPSYYERIRPDGTVTKFSTSGYMLSLTDRFGDSTAYHYNASNLLTAIVDPIGDSITLAYASSKLSTVTDPGGRVTHVTIDGSGDLTTIKDPTGTTTFGGTYDVHHRLTQMADRGGNTWLYRYDFASKIASDSTPVVLADGTSKRLGTHFRSTLASELIDTASHTGSSGSPAAHVTRDSVWAWIVQPAADSLRFAVDPFGDPTVLEDLTAQIVTTETRDNASHATDAITTSHGHTLQHLTAVWSGGDLVESADPIAGTAVTYKYDSTYHILTGTGGNAVPDTFYVSGVWADSEKIGAGASAGVFAFAHDAHGRLTQVTDPAGHVYSATFDSAGFHNAHTSIVQNRVTTFRYDRYGRADSVTLPGGSVMTVSLDSLNRPRKSSGPNGVHVTYAYDSLSGIRTITDADGQSYLYTHNALGWLIARINADTNHTLSARTDSFFFSGAGLVTKHRDRNGLSTTLTYDGLGRTLTQTLADGRVTRFSYDPNGLFRTDSNAASIDTVRIDSAHLVETEFTKQAGRSYTEVSSATALGLIKSFLVKQSTTLLDSLTFGYDGAGRLDTLRTGASRTFLTYADDGLLSTWKLPTGDSMIVTYSKNHKPLSISYSRIGLHALYESVSRDTLDRVAQQTLGTLGDTVRFFAYDSTGRLKTYADSVSVDSLICVPDPNGQDGQHCSPAGGWTLASQSAYAYDSAYNRDDLGAALTAGNRATTFNGYTLTYDNVGNLTHKSKSGFDQFYYWNSIGQLDSVVTNGTAAHFAYDGRGRRVQKRNSTQDLRYVYSGLRLITEVDSASGSAQKIYRYYPGFDRPHSVKEATGTYYYLAGLGTPGTVGLIDSTGSLKDRYRYAPWGGLEDSLETIPNVLKFASREYDAETHLYYDRARYYDPQLSRFISEDPIGLAGGINQYAYASDDPTNFSDPSGLEPCPFIYQPYCGWTLSGVTVWAASQEDQFMQFSVGGFDGPPAGPSGPKRPQPADARRLMDGEPGPGSPPPAKKPSHALSCGAAVANAAINFAEDALLFTGIGAVAEATDDIATGLEDAALEDFSIEYEPPPPGDYNTMRSVAITIGGTAYKNGANLARDAALSQLATGHGPSGWEIARGFIPGVRTYYAIAGAVTSCSQPASSDQ